MQKSPEESGLFINVGAEDETRRHFLKISGIITMSKTAGFLLCNSLCYTHYALTLRLSRRHNQAA